MKKIFFLVLVVMLCFLLSCYKMNRPFSQVPIPPKPNYQDPAAWAALPSKTNNSMDVPDSALKNEQAHAAADVFYIYPTHFFSQSQWNAAIDDEEVNEMVEEGVLRTQASVFNNVAKIYAPIYRQATLFAFVSPEEGGPPVAESNQALSLAYKDIQAAFDYYMQHYNHGRPFFIVAHSQGSFLAKRLIRENENKYPLSKQLLVAYIVGERLGSREFKTIPVCRSPDQVHCYLGWQTVEEGEQTQLVTGSAKGNPVCINPLTFNIKKPAASFDNHLGGVPEDFDEIVTHAVSAECKDGILWISPVSGFPNESGDYNESYYSLFFMNIRENAKLRVLNLYH